MRVCQQRCLQPGPRAFTLQQHIRGLQSLRCRSQSSDAQVVEKLRNARSKAVELFATVKSKGLLAPGSTEGEVDKQVFQLAAADHGTRQHWHKRLPRFGENTVHPIFVDRPDTTLRDVDICFLDLGPVFERVEADFGRTFVIGQDAERHKLNEALVTVFDTCKQHYLSNPGMTGAELFDFVMKTTAQHGYRYAHDKYCAHLIGEFSHAVKFGENDTNYACPGNHTPMNAPHPNGAPRHWILEIHLIHQSGGYGGFYEDLLDITV